ncbi:MAG: hypothetical protein ACOC0P_04520 [Planctomycetota bacterium]
MNINERNRSDATSPEVETAGDGIIASSPDHSATAAGTSPEGGTYHRPAAAGHALVELRVDGRRLGTPSSAAGADVALEAKGGEGGGEGEGECEPAMPTILVRPAFASAPASARAEATGSRAGRSCQSNTGEHSDTEASGERSCGSCSACCISLYIRSLAKPAGEPCSYLKSPTGGGCTIHGSRFPVCREFFCMWIRDKRGLLREEHRPDKLGLILTAAAPDEQGRQTIHAHEVWADASEQSEAKEVIAFLRQFAPVDVHFFRTREARRTTRADAIARAEQNIVIRTQRAQAARAEAGQRNGRTPLVESNATPATPHEASAEERMAGLVSRTDRPLPLDAAMRMLRDSST